MEKTPPTRVSLEIELKKLEVKEKKLELDNMERRLSNITKGLVIDQISSLTRLLETRIVDSNPARPGMSGADWINAFDNDDQIKIKAKIMRLINTF